MSVQLPFELYLLNQLYSTYENQNRKEKRKKTLIILTWWKQKFAQEQPCRGGLPAIEKNII